MAHPNTDQVFGLTAVNLAAPNNGSPNGTADVPLALPTAAAAAAALPGIPTAAAAAVATVSFGEPVPAGFLSPAGAAAAGAATAAYVTSGRATKSKPLATPPTQQQQLTTVNTPDTEADASSGGGAAGRGYRSSNPGTGHRLPPIGNGGIMASGEERVRVLTTPTPRGVTPGSKLKANSDTRNFDGKDLHDLVKLSWQDYSDVSRVQRMVEVGLSSNTTEASRVEALMQIREASIQNPLFSITAAILSQIREHLISRNRLLRPAAAYAIAGYAANSRYGRGLMSLNSYDILPRLNSMLRCRVDSLDARYASLAVLSASMHPEHKELVGKSGSIPLLMNLVRQNIGRTTPVSPTHAEAMEYLIGTYDNSERSTATTTSLNSYNPDFHDSHSPGNHDNGNSNNHQLNTPRKQALNLGTSYSYNPGSAGLAAGTPSLLPSQSHSVPPVAFNSVPAVPTSPFYLEPPGSHSRAGGGGMWSGGGGGYGDLPTSPSKGAYLLQVKPAAAHALAALVNLAELPANRQRMRDAGIAAVLEDVMLSRNDNILRERCRLLIDLFQMDTNRFKEIQASTDLYTVTSVSQAVVNFIQRGRDGKTSAAAVAAGGGGSFATVAAAAAAFGHGGGSGSGSAADGRVTGTGSTLGLVGGTSPKGSLAYNLVRQLERGDQEGERRAGTVTLKQRNPLGPVSRMHSQVVARVQSYVRKPATSSTGAPPLAAAPPSSELQSTITNSSLALTSSFGLQQPSSSSGGP